MILILNYIKQKYLDKYLFLFVDLYFITLKSCVANKK